MKVVNKAESKVKVTVKYRQRDCYGNAVYKVKTLYFTDIPMHDFWVGCIDSDKIRNKCVEIVKNQQSNIETFVVLSVTLAIKNKDGEFVPAA